MCAIAIGAIMISVLFYGLSNGFKILRGTRDELRATQILMQKTEAFRLYRWDQLSNCPTTFTEYYNPTGTNVGSKGTLYYGKLSTTATATNISSLLSYRSDLHLITITVAWTNTLGSHTRQMQTLSARNGLQNYLIQ